ncbi:hypothetical protein LR48_Vigan01g126000 [Vigna angularis]|uniref:Uncharacterized protein n=1 Tax=Phaseolus angularis TaxID=3914 RepID=A0A0L9TMB9_PHAAN|nr:hypothetical protein LR48_Vigan01g126000 [Vigna angularis]
MRKMTNELTKVQPNDGERSNCSHGGIEDINSKEKVEMEETRKEHNEIFEKHSDK